MRRREFILRDGWLDSGDRGYMADGDSQDCEVTSQSCILRGCWNGTTSDISWLSLVRAACRRPAKALGVNQSTVQRRLVEFEGRVGQRLVERHLGGYRLTELGGELRPAAEAVESALVSVCSVPKVGGQTLTRDTAIPRHHRTKALDF
jgi:hypothetical protein